MPIPESTLQSCLAALAVPDRRPIYDWASDHVFLPQMYAQPGKFNVETSRYMLEPFGAIQDPKVRQVNILKAIQTGGTLISELAVLWIIVNDPGPIMWTFQSDEDAKEHCKSRWNPLMRSVEPIKPLLPKDRHMRNTQEIYFGPYFLIVNGANLNSLQSKSIRWKVNDETWLWKDGLMQQAKGRVSAFEAARTSKVINISQAGIEDSDWDTECRSGTWADWGFGCDCGEEVPLLREHLKWDEEAKDPDTGDWLVARCAETAHFKCPHCGKEWDDSDRTRGIWNKRGRYIAKERKRDDVLTFRWNSLVNRDMSSLVAELVEGENMKNRGVTKPLAELLQKRFAEFVGVETFEDEVEIHLGGYTMTEYFEGAKWEREVERLMTIDRQMDHFYCNVRAYRSDGSSRLLYRGRVGTKEQLREVQERFGVKDWKVGLDSSYQTEDCYRLCAEYKWLALEGSEHTQEWRHKDGKRRFFSPHQQHKIAGQVCNRHMYGGEPLKDILARLREQPGVFEIPDDVGDQYIDAMSSEAKKQIVSKSTGRLTWKWIRVKRNNHDWDCEVMQLALAMIHNLMHGVSGTDKKVAEVVVESEKPKAPDPEPLREQVRRPQRVVSGGKNWVTGF